MGKGQWTMGNDLAFAAEQLRLKTEACLNYRSLLQG
jgi:hypothetical protein